jgi:hypothetical protein
LPCDPAASEHITVRFIDTAAGGGGGADGVEQGQASVIGTGLLWEMAFRSLCAEEPLDSFTFSQAASTSPEVEPTVHRSTGMLSFARTNCAAVRPQTAWRGAAATATLGREEWHVGSALTDIDHGLVVLCGRMR